MPVSNAVQSLDKRLLGDTLLQFPYLTAFTTMVLAILLSIAVYGLVEEPGRRWILRRFGRPVPVPNPAETARPTA
jgi:peptidoglycan/LPS O-acetylase OafA/YrhL